MSAARERALTDTTMVRDWLFRLSIRFQEMACRAASEYHKDIELHRGQRPSFGRFQSSG